MTDHDQPGDGWDATLDRRDLLGRRRSPVARSRERASSPAYARGAAGRRQQRHVLLDPARAGRRVGGVPQDAHERFRGQPPAIFAASDAEFDNRVKAEASGKGSVDLLGALHGSFSTLEDKNILMDLSDLVKDLSNGKTAIGEDLMTLGKLGTRSSTTSRGSRRPT